MKKLLILFFIITSIFILIPISRAADQTITCISSGCSGIADALFNELGVAPGVSVTKSIEIINNQGETIKLAMSVSKNEVTDDDFTKLVDVIVNTDGFNNRFTGTLESFLTSYIDLEKLENNQHRLVDITLSLTDVGNEYQGKQAKFSFDIKIEQETPGTGVGGGGDTTTATSPSPSPLVLGTTSFINEVENIFSAVLGESSPSAGPAELISGLVKGRSTWPQWLLILPLPIIIFFFLKWLGKHRRMKQ